MSCCFEEQYPQMNNCCNYCYQINPNYIKYNYCNNNGSGNEINNKINSYDEEMNLIEFNMKVDVLKNKISQMNNEFSNINFSNLSQQNEKFKQKINSFNYNNENDKIFLSYQLNENNISHNNSNFKNPYPNQNDNKGEINNLNLSANNINYKNNKNRDFNNNIIKLKRNNSNYHKLNYPKKRKSYTSQYDKYFSPSLLPKQNELYNNQVKNNQSQNYNQYQIFNNNRYNISNNYNFKNNFPFEQNQNNSSMKNINTNSVNFGSYDNYFLGSLNKNNLNNNNFDQEENKGEMNMKTISNENQGNNYNIIGNKKINKVVQKKKIRIIMSNEDDNNGIDINNNDFNHSNNNKYHDDNINKNDKNNLPQININNNKDINKNNGMNIKKDINDNNNDINNLIIDQKQALTKKNNNEGSNSRNENKFINNKKEDINTNNLINNKQINIDKMNKKIETSKKPVNNKNQNDRKDTNKKHAKKLSFHEEDNITIKYDQKEEITNILIYDANNRLRKLKPRNINVYLSKLKRAKPKTILKNSNSIPDNKEEMKKSYSASSLKLSMKNKNKILNNYNSNNISNKSPLRQVSKDTEIKKRTPKKEICEKFVKNPQQFYTEELCDLVLKSFDFENKGSDDKKKDLNSKDGSSNIKKKKDYIFEKEVNLQAYYNLKKYFEENNLDD